MPDAPAVTLAHSSGTKEERRKLRKGYCIYNMYYGNIKNTDIANGSGVRVSLFVSGCTNRCKGCFQPETWDFCYGKPFTAQVRTEILEMLSPDYINGLTVLGGEPMEPANQSEVLTLLKQTKEKYPNKDIWVFTGFTLEELLKEGSYPRTENTEELLSLIDVLVDGRFEEDKKDISLRFRGSSNQRIIDLPATLKNKNIVLWDK